MTDHLISRSRFLDALVLDADNKTDLIQVHQALEKAVVGAIEELVARDVVPTDFHERCLQLEIRKRIELEKQIPRWISVDERLPEDGKDVLCWYEYYHWSKDKVLPEYGIGYYIYGYWGGEVSNGRDCKVLYWCPLPAPPKEDAK